MRRLFLIASLFLLCCCGRRQAVGPLPDDTPHRAALDAVDSLMWCRPDSAFAALLAFNDAMGDTALCDWEECRFHLLLAELLYKNDYEQSNRAELIKAVSYFDSLAVCRPNDAALAFLEARAHYINGVGCLEADSIVTACSEYLMALQLMEDHFEEKDRVGKKARFLTYAYSRLGELFSEYLLTGPSIVCFKQALHYCRIEPTSPFGVSRILDRIGAQYSIEENNELAQKYYQEALEQMPDNDNGIYRKIQFHIAVCNYDMGLGMNAVAENLRQIISMTDDERELSIYTLFIGYIYAEEKLYDSAIVYLEPLYTIYSELEAAKCLRTIYDSLGYTEKADECMRFLAENIPSEGEAKVLTAKLNKLFLADQDKRSEVERRRYLRKVVWMSVPLFAVAVLVIFIMVQIKARRRIVTMDMWHRLDLEAERRHHETTLEERQKLHQSQLDALSGRLKHSNQELKDLKRHLETGRYQPADTISPQAAASFADEPVCLLIMQRVKEGHFKSKVNYKYYRDYALDKPMLLDLRVAADHHFRQFTMRLKNDHPELTNGDLNYCCLYLLGLSDADVAALMQRAYNTVVERNKKIRRLLGSEKPLPIALKGIAECICN